jgi:hypothetical protein
MSAMSGFTHDFETAELSGEECAAFGRLVDDLCHRPEQRRLSAYLAAVVRPQQTGTCDLAERHARRMWRSVAYPHDHA